MRQIRECERANMRDTKSCTITYDELLRAIIRSVKREVVKIVGDMV